MTRGVDEPGRAVTTAEDVRAILRWLDAVSVDVWLDGGWGVDALVGEQSRPHSAVDIVVHESDVARVRWILGREGFQEKAGGTAWNFVLVDESGREVDVHAVRFDEAVNALYGPDGLMYPAGSLDAIGTVQGTPVRCKTADAQVADRIGYPWRAGDYHDVELLHARLGVPLPTPMRQWADAGRWARLRSHESCVIYRAGRPNDVLVELEVSWVTVVESVPIRGYACLVCRRHVVELHELSDIEGAAFMRDMRRLSAAVQHVTGAAKLNYEIHGNTIPHLHMHVYPRHPWDSFDARPASGEMVKGPAYEPRELGVFRGRLRAALAGGQEQSKR